MNKILKFWIKQVKRIKCYMYHNKFRLFMLKLLELKKTHSTFKRINDRSNLGPAIPKDKEHLWRMSECP